MKNFQILGVFLMIICISCSQAPSYPLSLASFSKNSVSVSISLQKDEAGQFWLSALLTPDEGLHLYSKDTPLTGVNGVGRPALLEATAESQYVVAGILIESVAAQIPEFEPKELLVYPPGPVTLSLPIELPPGDGWVDDFVQVTYMACSDSGCRAPVFGMVVPIQIPAMNALH